MVSSEADATAAATSGVIPSDSNIDARSAAGSDAMTATASSP
jgi:hypothetical protein